MTQMQMKHFKIKFFNINWTDLQIFEKFYTHIMVRPQENYLFSERLLCTVRSFAINLSISVWTQSQTNQCWCFCFCFVEGNTETFNLSREKNQVNHSCKLHVLNTEMGYCKLQEVGLTVKSFLFITVISIINYSLACAINMTVCVICTKFYW